jgi:hypothetical protein
VAFFGRRASIAVKSGLPSAVRGSLNPDNSARAFWAASEPAGEAADVGVGPETGDNRVVSFELFCNSGLGASYAKNVGINSGDRLLYGVEVVFIGKSMVETPLPSEQTICPD